MGEVVFKEGRNGQRAKHAKNLEKEAFFVGGVQKLKKMANRYFLAFILVCPAVFAITPLTKAQNPCKETYPEINKIGRPLQENDVF